MGKKAPFIWLVHRVGFPIWADKYLRSHNAEMMREPLFIREPRSVTFR
jgi:hypothetical protein